MMARNIWIQVCSNLQVYWRRNCVYRWTVSGNNMKNKKKLHTCKSQRISFSGSQVSRRQWFANKKSCPCDGSACNKDSLISLPGGACSWPAASLTVQVISVERAYRLSHKWYGRNEEDSSLRSEWQRSPNAQALLVILSVSEGSSVSSDIYEAASNVAQIKKVRISPCWYN